MNKDWIDIEILEDYLDGKLDARTMNRVEREALDDPFVAEALAGLSASPRRSLESLSLLQKQLKERIAQQQTTKRTSVITWQRLSIAAAAAVLFVSVSIIFWMKQVNQQQIAAKRPKKVEVSIAPRVFKDSIVKSADAVAVNEIKKPVKPTANLRRAAKIIPPVAVAANVLSGKVVAQDNGEPLPGAAVKIEGTALTAITDARGEFVINSDTILKDPKILASYLGFKPAELLAKMNTPVSISLTPDHSTLNEVVIASYAKRKKEKADLVLAGKVSGMSSRDKKESSLVTLNGTIEKLGITTFQYGTHLLKAEGKAYALKSVKVDLDQYVNKQVTLKGNKVAGYPVENGPELIEVIEVNTKLP